MMWTSGARPAQSCSSRDKSDAIVSSVNCVSSVAASLAFLESTESRIIVFAVPVLLVLIVGFWRDVVGFVGNVVGGLLIVGAFGAVGLGVLWVLFQVIEWIASGS